MPKHLRNLFLALILCHGFLTLFAQDDSSRASVEMADRFRSEGKIYVVVATMVIILVGIVLYLLRTEKRLRRLERKD